MDETEQGLQDAHDAAAADVAAFEARQAEVDAAAKAERVAVNDRYREAAWALEAYRVANADPDRPPPTVVSLKTEG